MSFLEKPNVPDKKVSLIAADFRLHDKAVRKIKEMGIDIIYTKPNKTLYQAVSGHPDIQFVHIAPKIIVHEPDLDSGLVARFTAEGFKLVKGCSRLGKYPLSVPYNVAIVGKNVFLNIKLTDEILKRKLTEFEYRFINIKQGYSKCSISIIDDNSIITADKGIAKAAEKVGIDSLLIEPDPNIKLPGIDHGFIGGATGLLSNELWAIHGNFEYLKDADKIFGFINSKEKKIISLTDSEVVDVGSLIPLK